jgi:DNA-binding NarL/FixJ family response regulator
VPIRTIIIDDQPLIREGLSIILDAQDDIEIVGQGANGQEAIRLADRLCPDVILMDIKMPHVNGIQATRKIKSAHPEMYILILTTYSQDELVFDGIRAGASGYLLKDITRQELAEAVRGAARGEAQIDPSVASQVLTEFKRMANVLKRRSPRETDESEPSKAAQALQDVPPIEALTPREETILQLMTEGLTNAGIANRLHLSEGTVKNYVSEILAKLQANDRTHAVVLAIRRGLLDLS